MRLVRLGTKIMSSYATVPPGATCVQHMLCLSIVFVLFNDRYTINIWVEELSVSHIQWVFVFFSQSVKKYTVFRIGTGCHQQHKKVLI